MKKVLSIVLSLVMVLCMVPTMAFADSAVYSDIEGEKCEASVELLTELGVVEGYGDGTYQPDAVVTRAEMAKLIVTQLGLNPTSSTTSFTDMDAAKWAIPHVGYAESLGIITGYGDGRFGPNDPVTYDQVVTMIVRAVGYTEACNEMQGQWPAVFVQKANELGILKNVGTTGDAGANRGDVAIMLANALDVRMVYADNDGVAQYRKDTDGNFVTMYQTLVKEGGKYYGVVDDADVENATKNITDLLGAAGQIVYNEDEEVISVSDIKSTFMTGKFNDKGTTFTVDGVEYKVDADSFKILDGKGKPVESATVDKDGNPVYGRIPMFHNGQQVGSARTTSDAGITFITEGFCDKDTNVTLACITNGKTITAIFSAQKWTVTESKKIKESDANRIDSAHTLLGVAFAENVDGDINEDFFLLEGVDSLDEITEDHVVYVYAKANDEDKSIAKIEVGAEVVTGEVTKSNVDTDDTDKNKGEYVVIDGTQYDIAPRAEIKDEPDTLKPGNIVNLYLDYNGKVYAAEVEDGTAGNYAIIIDADGFDTSALKSVKMQLMTAEGAKVFNVNTSKFTTSGEADKVPYIGTKGTVVKYALDSEGQIKDLEPVALTEGSSTDDITVKGYLDSKPISDTAVIFEVPAGTAQIKGDSSFASTGAFDYSKPSKISVLTKESILDSENIGTYVYAVNSSDYISFLVVLEGTGSNDDIFGVVNGTFKSADGTGANFIAETEALEADDTANAAVTVAGNAILYQIKFNANGSVDFTAKDAAVTMSALTADDIEDLVVSDNQIDCSNIVATKVNAGSENKIQYLADDVVVYIYDKSDAKYAVGDAADIDSKKNIGIQLYKMDDEDNAGLVTHVIIVRE